MKLFEVEGSLIFWFHPLFPVKVKDFILRSAFRVSASCTDAFSCQRASVAWFDFLDTNLKNHSVELKEGFYYPNGELEDEYGDFAGEGHVWLEVDGLIFDPTAGQFDDFPNIDDENYEESN